MTTTTDFQLLSKEKILNNVRYAVVRSTDTANRVKAKEILDLAVVFVVFDEDKVIFLPEFALEFFDITVTELIALAEVNTMRAGFKAQSMQALLGVPDDENVPEFPFLRLTNNECFYGASAILYGKCLADIAEKFDDDLWIIPSSVHELLVMPRKYGNAKALSRMIRDVNAQEVDEKYQLGDEPYLYRRDLHCLDTIDELEEEASFYDTLFN